MVLEFRFMSAWLGGTPFVASPTNTDIQPQLFYHTKGGFSLWVLDSSSYVYNAVIITHSSQAMN